MFDRLLSVIVIPILLGSAGCVTAMLPPPDPQARPGGMVSGWDYNNEWAFRSLYTNAMAAATAQPPDPHGVIKNGSRFLNFAPQYDSVMLHQPVLHPADNFTRGMRTALTGRDYLFDAGDEYSRRLALWQRFLLPISPDFWAMVIFESFGVAMFSPLSVPSLFVWEARGTDAVASREEVKVLRLTIAESYCTLGRLDEAIAMYESALDMLESSRDTIAMERERIGFQGSVNRHYERLIDLLIQRKRFDDAFRYVERTKGRAFADLMAGASLKITGRRAEPFNELRSSVIETRLAMRGRGSTDEINTTIGRGQRVQRSVVSRHPEFEVLGTSQTIDAERFGTLLGSRVLAIEYFRLGDDYWAMALRRGKVATAYSCGRAADIDRQVLSFHEAINRRGSVGKGKADVGKSDALELAARALFDRLVRPSALDASDQALVIVPAGSLFYLPFAVLSDGQAYLVERVNLSYLPSATLSRYCYGASRTCTRRAMILANPTMPAGWAPLPGAEREGHAIAQILGDGSLLLTGDRAAATQLRDTTAWNLIHLATHAYYRADKPFESGLVLAPGVSEDGLVTAEDIFSSTFSPGTMVVLSACEGGLARVVAGDEALGLTRAFMFAGAKTVVSSLWPVPDEATARFMNGFYRHLATGKGSGQALAETQRAAIAMSDDIPIWAAFSLVGDAR